MTGTNVSIFPTLQAIADTERLYDNPDSRRAWLLSQALKDYPLLKALEIAQFAERFLSGDPSERSSTTEIFSRLDPPKVVGLPATREAPVALPTASVSRITDGDLPTEWILLCWHRLMIL